VKGKELLILSLGVFLTIIAWMMLDIYHIQTKITEQINIKPAQIPNYVMDKTIIDLLKQKKE
jgi:hypothetical protein